MPRLFPLLFAPADSGGASGDALPPSSPPAQGDYSEDGKATAPPVVPLDLLGAETADSLRVLATRDGSGLPSASELEQTLQRLMRRVSMLVQAEKCVFLLHDRERDELVARPPAIGLTREQVRTLRLSRTEGVAARAFDSGEPCVVTDVTTLMPLDQVWARRVEARNFIAYPLTLERHDNLARTHEHLQVGVFLVLNKRGKSPFTPEDLALLSVMAHQVTAVIADAQVYLQLTEEKEQLQATLLSMGSGVLMIESTGHISLLNPAARALLGLPGGEGDGAYFEDAIKNEGIVQLLRDATQNGHEGAAEIEVELPGRSDARIYQAQTAFVRGEKAGVPAILGVVVIFNDITEIRNVDRMKTAFVSTVSHELRTPLTSIKGFISTLLQDTDDYFDRNSRHEFYSIIDAECDRLRRLIDDLLNVSRIESGRALQMNWSLFEPLAAIERALQAQRSYTDKHRLILDYLGQPIQMLGDSDKFDQILTNLLSNAVKYSPNGGDILVTVQASEDDLSISIHDQGMGIAADKLDRVFQKFERVDNRDTRQAGGTGIGLFLVKHLVERHEGTIDVASQLGGGSTFTIHLPLRPKEALAELEHGIDPS